MWSLEFKGDFDNDGKFDRIVADGLVGSIKVEFGDGKVFLHELHERTHDLQVEVHSLRKDKLYPSILIAHTAYPWRPSGDRVQYIIANLQGKLEAKMLPFKIFGRHAKCYSEPLKDGAVCFYSSYRGISKLVQFDSLGNGVDVTQNSNLPFAEPIIYANGYHMMASAFADLNLDRKPDLVVVGQHSEIFVAMGTNRSGTKYYQSGFSEPTGEHMRVYHIRSAKVDSPCFYHAMEIGESKFPDFVRCYDADEDSWYKLDIPGKAVWDFELTPVGDHDSNGQPDFAQRKDDGSWSVYNLVEVEFALQKKSP